MQRSGKLVGLMTLLLVATVAACVAAGPDVPANISGLRDKVAAAVARDAPSSLATEPEAGNLQLLAPSLSLPSDAQLRVTSVRAGYLPGSWFLRLDCTSRRDCLPFHIALRLPGSELAAKGPGKGEPRSSQVKSLLARSGDHVLLVEERSGLRLKMPVVCLQSGGLGDQIRVRNVATQRILVATIAGKNLVRVE